MARYDRLGTKAVAVIYPPEKNPRRLWFFYEIGLSIYGIFISIGVQSSVSSHAAQR